MRRAAAAALALLLLALAACDDERAPVAAKELANPRVLVVGDSNVFLTAAPVARTLRRAGLEPTVHGVPGYGLKDLDRYWVEKLPELLETDPAVVVVALGTNDTTTDTDILLFATRLDETMEIVGDHPVVWLTHVDDRPGTPAAAGRAINEAVRAAADRWRNLVVLDFAEVINDDPDVLAPDLLHFGVEGAKVYAEAIKDAVLTVYASCDGEPAPACV